MNAALATAERASPNELVWITACLALTLLAGIANLPIWVSVTVAAAATIRLARAMRGHGAPPRAIRLAVSLLAIGLLFLQFRTFNGLSAGIPLLSLVAGLKLLETQTRRDLHVVVMIIYFLSLATLLESESIGMFGYLVAVCWLTASTQLCFTAPPGAARPRAGLRHAARLMAQAVPIAMAFWLFFPRFGGPLWQLPDDGGATSGLSDNMSPGDITDLAMSDEVAFRVRFISAAPPPQDRYWRGPVLHDFDGRAWQRTESQQAAAPPLQFRGPAVDYVVSLEPNHHPWIFVLDWPSRWDVAHSVLTNDYMLVRSTAIAQPLDVKATSFSHVTAMEPLSNAMRRRDTHLPPGRNLRTVRMAQQLRAEHPDDLGYVHSVLDMFRNQEFFYTLQPPRLSSDSMDDFLFRTRRGFCGHYASAFATLMRAAGIPTRVVTGYQGGTFNRFANYWILRQSDAHAWDEVWLEGHGWLRIDPTSMIAPERVERGLNDLLAGGDTSTSRWQQRTPWLADTRLRLDALRLLWRERILEFNSTSQEQLLGWLHVPEPDGEKLALVLAGCLITGMAWLTWQVRRELVVRPRSPVDRAYARLCGRLASIGLPRPPHEGAEAFAARVAMQRPDLAPALEILCRHYTELRYSKTPGATDALFLAGVRRFRPRGSRGSLRK